MEIKVRDNTPKLGRGRLCYILKERKTSLY
jgi:hypothetical protein